MAGRPFTYPITFGTAVGTEPMSALDTQFAAVGSIVNDSAIGYNNYASDTGSANNYVLTLASAPSAYLAGMTVAFLPGNSNTGPSTINVN